MPELHETRVGRAFFERDVPEIARQLARIADALERLADAGDRRDPERDRPAGATDPNTTTEPAEGEDLRGAAVDEPRDPGA